MINNGKICSFSRYIMLDFPVEKLGRHSMSYVMTPPKYQTDCPNKNVQNFLFLIKRNQL